jgi:hypothetical protein
MDVMNDMHAQRARRRGPTRSDNAHNFWNYGRTQAELVELALYGATRAIPCEPCVKPNGDEGEICDHDFGPDIAMGVDNVT